MAQLDSNTEHATYINSQAGCWCGWSGKHWRHIADAEDEAAAHLADAHARPDARAARTARALTRNERLELVGAAAGAAIREHLAAGDRDAANALAYGIGEWLRGQ